LFNEDEGSELGVIVLEGPDSVIKFDDRVHSGKRNVIIAQVGVVASA